MIHTDVCIVGAGPGGVATAIKLDALGIPHVVIDKAIFPRDKICGDAISSKVLTLLGRLDPDLPKQFAGQATPAQSIHSISFIAPNQREVNIPFRPPANEALTAPGYVMRRWDFDHFLVEALRNRPHTQLLEQTAITYFERTPEGFLLSDATRQLRVQTRLLIDASGANSKFSRKAAGLIKDPKHHAGAVRAYFRKVEGLRPDVIELHFIKSIVPGYFWIFPLPDGYANIGLGLRTDVLSRRRINLRAELQRLLETHPVIRKRFAYAELIGDIKGFPLPLGSKVRPISGDHYLLVGDAAHLIDPLTGEGIGNAFYSGSLAAEQAQFCLNANNFSAAFMQTYDRRVRRVLGSEMRWSYRLQRMLTYPWLASTLANVIADNPYFVKFCSELAADLSNLERLFTLPFWWRILQQRRR